MKIEEKQFDERQLQIRKNIFKHGFFVAIGALLLNAFLNDTGIVWANPFHQNITILILLVTVVSIEFHIHGVYFGKNISHIPILAIFGGCAIALTVLTGINFAEGKAFITNGSLTTGGVAIIHCILCLLNVSCGIIQFLRNSKDKKS
jgi:hypothetical protein